MIEIDKSFGLNDRYDILKTVGEGGMGTVFKAYDNILKEYVAIKTLNPKLALNESVKNRFLNEAKICLTLTHPNIIRVRDVNIYDETYYMVMEYLEGVELKDIMKEQNKNDVKGLYLLIKPIFEALEYAHNFTIHRDIKPANIMMKNKVIPVLMDFGISKALENSELDNETVIGGMGTKKYISPEQAFNANDVDKKTDIYSMGVLFYELLTDVVPKNAAVEQAKSPSSYNSNIPPEIDSIILQMLEAKPLKRQNSFAEIISLLDSIFFKTTLVETPLEESPSPTIETKNFNLTNMIKIEAGNFLRGSAIESKIIIEKPRKSVYVDGFYISKYPVTNEEYALFLKKTNHRKPLNFDENLENKPNHPVVFVSYEDALAYCEYKNCSLPTEAQWEKAAKGGKNFTYPWGNQYEKMKANIAMTTDGTCEVDKFEGGKSLQGVYNLAGNVWEWCRDDFIEGFYKTNNIKNPIATGNEDVKVLRGGSFDFSQSAARTAFRFHCEKSRCENNIGFRIVKNMDNEDV
jgi:serine/threonine-protein kinase